jgi:hypothetical protein
MRFLGAVLGGLVASTLGLAVACSGSQALVSAPSACNDYFDALYVESCPGPTPPASEVDLERTEFATTCEDSMSLPGSGLTPSALEACAMALKALGCNLLQESVSACAVTGDLTNGSPCNLNAQCQSGLCSTSNLTSMCGVCLPVVPVGGSCAPAGGTSPACASGSTCGNDDTCVAITPSGKGGSCAGGRATPCAPGLYCASTGTCQAAATAGQTCGINTPCASPLACTGSRNDAGGSTCQRPGPLGAPCGDDEDCASGLGCSPTTDTCDGVAWTSGGQTCGGLTHCLGASCSNMFPGNDVPQGTCPIVLADGQPCSASDTTSVCNLFSYCTNGLCVPNNSVVCK